MRYLFLTPLTWLYALGLGLHRFLGKRRSRALPVPVISVGNLTVGGTGKTPLLLQLLGDSLRAGLSPAVLTRGYKGFGQSRTGIAESDEVRLMKRKFPAVPIGVGAHRWEAAMAILSSTKPSMFILDDGFQHWALRRDLDIVCIDAQDPWGGGHLLPLGKLRESKTALQRAGLIVLTRCELSNLARIEGLTKEIRLFNRHAPIVRVKFGLAVRDAVDGEHRSWDSLGGRPVTALSAIGNPEAFENNLRAMGLQVFGKRFLDHHQYKEDEIASVLSSVRRENHIVMTTEKDWEKLSNLECVKRLAVGAGVFVVELETQFVGDDKLIWDETLAAFQ